MGIPLDSGRYGLESAPRALLHLVSPTFIHLRHLRYGLADTPDEIRPGRIFIFRRLFSAAPSTIGVGVGLALTLTLAFLTALLLVGESRVAIR